MLIFLSHHPKARTGAHFRFDRLLQGAVAEGRETVWLSPAREDLPAPEGLTHWELHGPRWIPGRALRAVWGVWRQRHRLRGLQCTPARLVIFTETLYLAALLAVRLSGAELVVASRSNLLRRHAIRQSMRRNPLSRAYHGLGHVLARRIWAHTLHRAARVIVQSPTAREQLQAAYGLPDERLCVVENDVPQLPAAPRDDLPQTPGRLLYIGSGSPLKGLDILLGALHQLPDRAPSVRAVTIVGVKERSVRRALRGADASLPEIQVVPRTSGIYALMREHDLLVVPSREDQFPNALLEALACGTPAIGSRRDGIPHILGEKPLLFEPSPEDLVCCLARVATPQGYAAAAHACAEARERLSFNWEQRFLDAATDGAGRAPARKGSMTPRGN
ncbi:glycosyltransferase family 4 protein [Halorhodospira halophila]|uniref:glycosyltransferase family 4 protein n=1 Tax=Halorhodospira halophila TaxID=1053 RepID=UPI0019149724|nr:glycosyltransferase family 4 protein [Halorhodospira halophila]MBK5935375.1 hypothetical protein [Halorhodospira halophila]